MVSPPVERFGRYALLERLARGGMAEVFRAVQVGSAGFARQVAIKRMLPHLMADGANARTLVDEAKLAAELHHPNIVPVLDLGSHQGTFFLAMEFVSGQPVSTVLDRAMELRISLPGPFACAVVRQALAGLGYAHRKTSAAGEALHLVHRDISPQNIMVSYEGNVLLLDFGIAKAVGRPSETKAGVLKGKPGYFSPEVVRGEVHTQSADLYAMGVVLYELLAMQPMRAARSDVQMLVMALQGGFSRFDELGVNVPAPLAEVVYRALAPEPAQRWPDAQALLEALESVERALGWSWTAAQTRELLAHLFGDAMARERETQARLQPVISNLAVNDPAPPAPAPVAASPLPVRAPWTVRWLPVLAVGSGLAVLSATLAWWSQTAPPPGPVLEAPPPLEAAPVPAPTPLPPPAPEPAPPAAVSPEPAPARPVRRTTPAVSKQGTLDVQSTPWARVYLDGVDTGRFTPLLDLPVSAGTHVLRLVNDEVGKETKLTVKVPPGGHAKASAELH